MMPRDRRALALGACLVVAALLLRGIPLVVGAVSRLRDDVGNRSATVHRMRADVRGLAALGDSAALARRRLVALAPRILTGASEAEAVADLTGRLSALAAAHQAVVQRTEVVPDSIHVGQLARVTLHAVIESDLPGALATLTALEADPAVLTIRSVRVTAPDPGSSDAAPEVLSAEATVSGWYLKRKEQP